MANFTVEYRPYMSIGWNDDRLRARDSVVIHHDFSARRWIPTAVLVGILSVATPLTLWAMLSHEHDNTMEWVGYWVAVGVCWICAVGCAVDVRKDRHGYSLNSDTERSIVRGVQFHEYDGCPLGSAFTDQFDMANDEIFDRITLLFRTDLDSRSLLLEVLKAAELNREDVRVVSEKDYQQVLSEVGKVYAELTCDDNLKYLRKREETMDGILSGIRESDTAQRADKLRSDREMNHVSCGEGWND